MSAPLWVAVALTGLGGVALDRRQPERAARLLGAAEGLRAAVGVFPQIWDNTVYERDLSMVRALLGDRAAQLVEAGHILTLDEAVRLGLSGPEAAHPSYSEHILDKLRLGTRAQQ
jgi:hypothetical protein